MARKKSSTGRAAFVQIAASLVDVYVVFVIEEHPDGGEYGCHPIHVKRSR